MKKIMNTPETFVYDMCHGLAKAHPELEFVPRERKGAGPVAVGRVFREFGQGVHADAHQPFFLAVVLRVFFDRFQDLRKVRADEHGDNVCRFCFQGIDI